jgi:hypothetical protein
MVGATAAVGAPLVAGAAAPADRRGTGRELERAIVDLDAIADQAQPIERERMLAGARAALALASITSDVDDPDRIAALAGSARAFYRQWPVAYADRLAELESVSIALGASRQKRALP